MNTLIRKNRLDDTFGVAPFSRLFEDLWADFGATTWVPALNVSETADAYVVTAELPGVDPEKVEISLHEDRLEIRGEKSVEGRAEGKEWHRVERRHGLEATGNSETDRPALDRPLAGHGGPDHAVRR